MTSLALFAAAGPNGVFIPSDPKEAIWAAIAFFIIVGLLVWKLRPAISQALADRTAGIEAELEEARNARAEAEAALNASSADLPDLSSEEARIRTEAKETAAKLKADIVAKAEADAAAMVERGKADVAARKRQAQADLSAEVARMTRKTAEAVVLDGLDDGAQSDLIETYINQVSGMS